MVAWCVNESIIEQREVRENLYKLLEKKRFAFALHQIEEFLIDKRRQYTCISEVVKTQLYNKDLYDVFVKFPFSGYLTTNYDTNLEAVYAEVRQNELAKFYLSSMQHAVEASRNQEPYIVKLHGDIDHLDISQLRSRCSEDSSCLLVYQDQLRQLCQGHDILFLGFEKDDANLVMFEKLLGEERMLYTLPPQKTAMQPLDVNYSPGEARNRGETISVPSEIESFLHTLMASANTQPLVPTLVQQPQTQRSSSPQNAHALKVFVAYAQSDHYWFSKKIKLVLTRLEKSGHPIKAYEKEVSTYTPYILQQSNDLETADIILLLMSGAFAACDYCYCDQMHRAVKRHMDGACVILPIRLDESSTEDTPFAILPTLPSNGRPLKKWKDHGGAMQDIYNSIKEAIRRLQARQL
jgi:hypothetical protein